MSNLLLLHEAELYDKIEKDYEDKGGVYKLIAVKDGRRVTINRFLGTDPEGILYIGKADLFTDRVIELKKTIDPSYRTNSHTCGSRYYLYPDISKQFSYECLHVELLVSANPLELEKSEINLYANKFGEVPPLNSLG